MGLYKYLYCCNAGDMGSIPGSGRSPGEENGNPLQYSCLENSVDRGPQGHKEWNISEQLTLTFFTDILPAVSVSVSLSY